MEKIRKVFEEITSRFPKIPDEVRWILIDDVQPPSLLGDENLYPTNGTVMREHLAFRLMPRGMLLIPHRIEAASNFEGTLVHELGHLIQKDFEEEWRKQFRWAYCFDHEDDWEVRQAPNGERKWFNKKTGEMAPQGQFPLQPDQWVTYYAKQNPGEDFCESLVAYIYDPDLLKQVSPAKFSILAHHDAKEEKPTISARKVPAAEIQLPEIKPETIYYFVKEP